MNALDPIVDGARYRSIRTGAEVKVYGLGPVTATDTGTFEAVYFTVQASPLAGEAAGESFYLSRDKFREFYNPAEALVLQGLYRDSRTGFVVRVFGVGETVQGRESVTDAVAYELHGGPHSGSSHWLREADFRARFTFTGERW